MERIKITKLDAARRQFECAVSLFFGDADPVAIHTLAAASYDLLESLNKKLNGTEMYVKGQHTRLPGRPTKADINSVQNFFKHADRDPDAVIEFFPVLTETFLVDACKTYINITRTKSDLFICMMWWFSCRAGVDGFDFPPEKQNLLRDLLRLFENDDRKGFLKRCAERTH